MKSTVNNAPPNSTIIHFQSQLICDFVFLVLWKTLRILKMETGSLKLKYLMTNLGLCNTYWYLILTLALMVVYMILHSFILLENIGGMQCNICFFTFRAFHLQEKKNNNDSVVHIYQCWAPPWPHFELFCSAFRRKKNNIPIVEVHLEITRPPPSKKKLLVPGIK